MDAWLWGPAVASFLAPLAAAWRVWAGWTVWCLAVLAAAVGHLMVAAGVVLLGLFGSLVGFSPDWGAATASVGAPVALNTAALAGTWYLTRRVAGRAETTAATPSGQRAVPGGSSGMDGQRTAE